MTNAKVAEIKQNKPRRLKETSESKKSFVQDLELFMLLKTDLLFRRNKMVELLNTFVAKASNFEGIDHEDYDLHSIKIDENKQPIEDIYDDLIGNYMAEIPFIIKSPKFWWIGEANHRWKSIQSLYTQLENIKDKEGILRVFRETKGKKHGTWGHEVYNLQTWESRLSVLKSALEWLEKKELQ